MTSQACLLEPPGDACGEGQRTTVRLSALTVDDQIVGPGASYVPGPIASSGLTKDVGRADATLLKGPGQESTRRSVTTGMLGAVTIADIQW